MLTAASGSEAFVGEARPWTNALNPLDVNRDTYLSPIDAVLVINRLNARLGNQLPAQYAAPEPYYDVDGDTFISPIDAVLVINALNAAGTRSADPPAAAAGCNLIVTTTADTGPGSLREAINCANTDAVPDTISFNISGAGVKTISPTSALPTITNPVIIDGYTQPAASPNTNAIDDSDPTKRGFNGTLRIELSPGTSILYGLVVTANDSTIRGLVVNGFFSNQIVLGGLRNAVEGSLIGTNSSGTASGQGFGAGISILSSNHRIGGTAPAARNIISGNGREGIIIRGVVGSRTGNVIQGNLIGTDATGTLAVGNQKSGISLDGAINSLIGGIAPGARNIVSANGTVNNGNGIELFFHSNFNTVQGNYVGLDVTGTRALGNRQVGIGVDRSSDNLIGGTVVAARNVVSASQTYAGVYLSSASQNTIQGNFIGTDASGIGAFGNFLDGIIFFESNFNNIVGGTTAGAANLIAFNRGNGVHVGSANGLGNAILGNSIVSNAALGIELGGNNQSIGDGVTPNDASDADTGPNNLQNFPVVSSATAGGATVSVQYAVASSISNSAYPLRIEFFKADADGQEGQTFLGFDTYTAAEAGTTKTFSLTPAISLGSGDRIVATATDAQNNTSEFSASATIASSNRAPIANDDLYSVAEDTPFSFPGRGVLFNDSDPDGDEMTAVLEVGPAQGVLVFESDGDFLYTPAADYNGPDSFTYRATDGEDESDIATVSLLVHAVNDAPLGAADRYGVQEDTNLTIAAPGVLSNDTDVDGDPLTASLIGGALFGHVGLDQSGSFVYTPPTDFTGEDRFLYVVSDGTTTSDPVEVELIVQEVNDAPLAADDHYQATSGIPLTVLAPGVLANDFDAEGDLLSMSVGIFPTNGTLVLNSGGGFTYTPAANYAGPDGFTYQINDGRAFSNVATVTIDVTPGSPAALTARLIRDINLAPGGVQIDGDSLINFHGVAYFAGSIGGGDVELWRSDGTTAGTRRVKDIRPGPIGSKLNNLTAVDGLMFFSADDGEGGYELWKSDGSENGTVLVQDIQPGLHGSYPRNLLRVNSRLFFVANDGTSGYELWRSDGSTSGTMLVRDIADGDRSSYLRYLTNVGGQLFFAANDGVTGYELWKSDGTETGTALVKDIRPGVYPYSFVRELTNVNGTLFFRHDDGEHGAELWKSDGTEEGTTQVLDIRPGINGSNPRSLAAVNDTLFFAASADGGESVLWKSDGTAAGTVRTDNAPHPGSSSPEYLTNVNGRLFFFAQSGLWTSDGAGSALAQLKQLEAPSGFLDRRYLVNVDGTLFFRAGDGAHGQELWRTDGSPEGTVLLADTIEGIEGGEPRLLTNVGGRLFFAASDGTSAAELWTSDGTAAGTAHVVVPGATTAAAAPSAAVTIGGVAFFAATDAAGGRELWKTDGTTAGTVRVADIVPGPSGSSPRYLTSVGGTLYFTADNGASGRELWKSDGTAASTVLVRDIRPGHSSSSPHDLVNVGGTLFFSANDGTNGYELWKSDVAAGAVLVANIRPGAAASYPRGLTNVNGTLLFRANDGVSGFELWKSDGSAAGTALVSDIRAGAAGSYVHNLTNVNGTLFFAASGGESGVELWKSDGTSAGTMLVRDIRPGEASSLPRFLTNVNGQLFFRATDGLTGEELWKSDGTFDGTVLVRDIRSGSFDSAPAYLTNVGGTLFFAASGNASNVELWKSDGTEAGTFLVAEIGAGDSASFPALLTNVGGRLFFSAETAANGRELWTSDGTAAGTFQVAEIAAEGASSLPSDITDFRGLPLFTAHDGQLGRELWTVGDDVAVNQPPVAAGDSYNTLEDTPFVIAAPGLLANDTDADGDALSVRLETGPAHGALSLDADGGFRYLPAADFHGTDSFTYRAEDGTAASNVATVTITIAPVSDAPVISLSGGAPALEGSPFTGSGSFTDADGNAWTATVDYGDGSGTQPLALNADQTFALSHVYVENGVFGVTVIVTSASGASGSASLVAEIGNVAPRSLTFSGPGVAARGQAHSYFGTFSDPGVGDTHTARIDWGDGSVTTHAVSGTGAARQVAASHVYQASGSYQPRLTVTDDDGGTASQQTTVLVGGSGLDRGVLQIVGSSQADNVTIAIIRGSLEVFGSVGGATLSQSFAIGSVQRIVALLGGGDDMLTVSSTVAVPVLIDGGNGNDTLFAGAGPAILIGGSGNDALRGGDHRDLLIGGVGADQMNADGGGDLLIAGRTAYDSDYGALEAILAEWSAAGTYQERITRLRAGTGSIVQPLGIKLQHGETVFDDTVVDTLWGGSELDWFFYDPSQDQPLDKLAAEINR